MKHMDQRVDGGSKCNDCKRFCKAGIVKKPNGVRYVHPDFVCPGQKKSEK